MARGIALLGLMNFANTCIYTLGGLGATLNRPAVNVAGEGIATPSGGNGKLPSNGRLSSKKEMQSRHLMFFQRMCNCYLFSVFAPRTMCLSLVEVGPEFRVLSMTRKES